MPSLTLSYRYRPSPSMGRRCFRSGSLPRLEFIQSEKANCSSKRTEWVVPSDDAVDIPPSVSRFSRLFTIFLNELAMSCAFKPAHIYKIKKLYLHFDWNPHEPSNQSINSFQDFLKTAVAKSKHMDLMLMWHFSFAKTILHASVMILIQYNPIHASKHESTVLQYLSQWGIWQIWIRAPFKDFSYFNEYFDILFPLKVGSILTFWNSSKLSFPLPGPLVLLSQSSIILRTCHCGSLKPTISKAHLSSDKSM